MISRLFSTLASVLALTCTASAVSAQQVAPPANVPAAVEWNAETGHLRLRYNDTAILEATVHAQDGKGNRLEDIAVKLERAESRGEKDKVEQRLKLTVAEAKEGATVVLTGTVTGSEETFTAEMQDAAQRRFPVVRTSVGLSRNLRNNAVYDRHWDWALVGPADGATRILPKSTGKQEITFA